MFKMVKVGYHTQKVWYDKALKFAPSAQCGVNFVNGDTVFMSYITPVIIIHDNVLYCFGTYSRTTIKQIGRFLKEYAPSLDYYSVKAIAGTETGINILTGELINPQ